MSYPQREFTIGLVQMRCTEDVEANLQEAVARSREAADRGARIICLQELFGSRYFCQREDAALLDLAEPIPGPTTEVFQGLAAALDVAFVVPVFERRAAGVYHNSAAVIDADGQLLGVYRKMHIPDDPHFQEKFYFTPGDLGYRVFDTRHARLGVLICWDQWFPEAARLAALGGAEVILYPTAIGWLAPERDTEGEAQLDAWRTVQRGHAIANGVFVAAVNRVGHESGDEGGIEFWGSSFVCDPGGIVVGAAARDAAEVLVVQCDRHAIEESRRGWPFLRDRRVDSYQELTRRYLDG